MRWPIFAATLSSLINSVTALDSVEAYGNKFFNSNGTQFFIKGVAYQLVPQDPLVDADQCKRDFSLMKELGVNTIRVYHVDADGNHDECMKAMDDSGIYLLVDLDTFDTYIEATRLYWNASQYDRYSKVMDAFHSYNNVLGFFVGNENIAKKEDSLAAPFLKAAARDLKAYRDRKGYRTIPIGYSAADIVQLRPMLQDYLTCGGNSSEIIDFFSLNSYAWCDPSNYEKSSYDKLEEYAKDFPVPIFFSETGCNVPGPRLWEDQDAVFGKSMINDWSGSIVYEWIQEQNNYGLVSYGPKVDPAQQGKNIFDGFTRKGTPTPIVPDFDNLKTKWAGIHPAGVMKKDYDPRKVSTRPCPTSTADGWWRVNGNVKLPTLDESMTGTFTSQASATADPSKRPTSSSSPQENKGKEGKYSKDNGASNDKRIAAMALSAAGVVLGLALLL